jgi:glycosyltransferase involved in cell wall biosynthesis
LKRENGILIEYGTTAAKALPALRDINKRIVVHFHGHDAHRYQTLDKYREAYKEVLQLADAIIVVSERMRGVLIDLGASQEKIHCIPCGVDIEKFGQTDVSRNPPVFFSCGRFVEKKAPHLTLMAFHKAYLKNPAIRLRMAGDGPLLKHCQDLVSQLKLKDSVTLLGVISQERVIDELSRCRAFLQHSVTAPDGDSEGTPVGILEAGAVGVPVISTVHAGIPEAVLHGETGLLVGEFDIDGMSEAILKLTADPKFAQSLGENARNHIHAKYSLDDSIEKIRGLFATAQ